VSVYIYILMVIVTVFVSCEEIDQSEFCAAGWFTRTKTVTHPDTNRA